MKKITIDSNAYEPTVESQKFEVMDDKSEQLEIIIETNNPAWIQIFIKKDGKSIGQSLLTHQQNERIILIGRKNQLTSPTFEPQASLKGNWEITYMAKPHFPKSCDVVIHVNEQIESVEDTESEIDIFEECSKDIKGWVKGDFHTHTNLSDGKMSRTENIAIAKKQNLDFFFTTEHNVITRRWPKDEDMIIFPGIELTSDVLGHCNYLGVSRDLFSESEYEMMVEETGMLEIIQNNQDNGILSINHPYLKPWEWNTDLPLNMVTSLEVMNDPTYSDNTEATKEAFHLWTRLWNKGIKITGIGGSDSHLRPDEFYPGANLSSLIGDPGTYVYVEHLSQKNVLDAVKKGHTKISRIGEIDLKSKDKQNILPGEQLNPSIKHFEILLPDNKEEYKIDWVFDGEIIKTEHTSEQSEIQIETLDEKFHWLRADIKIGNEIVATFNPVYWNDKEPEVFMLKEVL